MKNQNLSVIIVLVLASLVCVLCLLDNEEDRSAELNPNLVTHPIP